jgi:long-chain acyl-CoA synthetase
VCSSDLKESKYIEQIAVIGNDKKFVSALIFPSKINFINWSKIKGIEIDFNNPNWVENEWINKKMQKVLDAFNEDFSQIEKIKKFKLLPNEWTVDGGELTPTLKVKRKFIDSKYHQEIESLYI